MAAIIKPILLHTSADWKSCGALVLSSASTLITGVSLPTLRNEPLPSTQAETARPRSVSFRILTSKRRSDQMGATWLDRRLLMADAGDLSPSGFGNEVRDAMVARREHLIEQGDATRQRNGRILYRRNLLTVLQDREVGRVGAELSASRGLPFRHTRDGETVKGTFKATRQLASGKFALIEKAHEFTLVPWRPVMDRQLDREVYGQMRGGSVSWQFGRQKGLGI